MVCVISPPVAFIVMVWFPSLTPLPTVTFMADLPEPGFGMELGLKATVTPVGKPVADKEMAESKPSAAAVVIVSVPELPLATRIDVGDALMVKNVGVTVRETVAISVMLPEVPSILMLYVPGTVDKATVTVRVEVPTPVIELGLRLTVTPAGWPLTDREMAESKPFITVLVMVEVAELPCATESGLGEAVRPKPGTLIVLIRPLIRALPFGLPQPVAKS